MRKIPQVEASRRWEYIEVELSALASQVDRLSAVPGARVPVRHAPSYLVLVVNPAVVGSPPVPATMDMSRLTTVQATMDMSRLTTVQGGDEYDQTREVADGTAQARDSGRRRRVAEDRVRHERTDGDKAEPDDEEQDWSP